MNLSLVDLNFVAAIRVYAAADGEILVHRCREKAAAGA
jgi:hypothetical protein